jgi:hypothetical protein
MCVLVGARFGRLALKLPWTVFFLFTWTSLVYEFFLINFEYKCTHRSTQTTTTIHKKFTQKLPKNWSCGGLRLKKSPYVPHIEIIFGINEDLMPDAWKLGPDLGCRWIIGTLTLFPTDVGSPWLGFWGKRVLVNLTVYRQGGGKDLPRFGPSIGGKDLLMHVWSWLMMNITRVNWWLWWWFSYEIMIVLTGIPSCPLYGRPGLR